MIMTDKSEEDNILRPKPLVLLLLDGFGVAPANEGNAFSLVKTNTISRLIEDYPVVLLSPLSGSVNQRYLSLGTAFSRELNDDKKEILPSLSSVLADNSLKQLKISESDRFAALTYFFNGFREDKLPQEEWQIVSSTLKNGKEIGRELVTKKIFKELSQALEADELADVIIVSLPSIDIRARSGDIEATKQEIILVDKLLRRVVEKVLEKNACLLISSAFGNAEKMLDLGMEINDNNPTQNPVPLIFVSPDFKGLRAGKNDVLNGDLNSLAVSGSLTDLPATILEILGLEPRTLGGNSLANNLL